MIRGRPRSIMLLVLVMLIWGSTYAVTKAGLTELTPMRFALLRHVIAIFVLVPIALLSGGAARWRQPVPWARLWLMALFGVALYYIAFNLALTRTTASQGALVQSSIPIVTALMATFWLGEKATPKRMLGIGLAVAGVLLIVARSEPDANARDPLTGNLLMFGSVVMWSAYTVLAKQLAHENPALIATAVTILGTILLVPPALVEVGPWSVSTIGPGAWLRIVYLGVMASAVAYLLYSRALRHFEASLVGAFINLSPVVGVLSGVVLLGDTVTPMAIAGGALVLCGLWISSAPVTRIAGRRRTARRSPERVDR